MTRNIEKSIESALEDYNSGNFTSLRAVATAYKLPRQPSKIDSRDEKVTRLLTHLRSV
jgi:hypothetical protein